MESTTHEPNPGQNRPVDTQKTTKRNCGVPQTSKRIPRKKPTSAREEYYRRTGNPQTDEQREKWGLNKL